MIIGDKREEVIENIRKKAKAGDFNSKVEVDDPVITEEERAALVARYLERRPSDGSPTVQYRLKRRVARGIANVATSMVNAKTPIIGIEKAQAIDGGALVTSNHFSPIDNTVVRKMAKAAGRNRLPIVIDEDNLAMDGAFGFLMNYADTIPLYKERHYLMNDFVPLLRSETDKGNFVLIYPEQEMWFNYRKPRPGKRGAYYYAIQLGVPILPCFVEIRDLEDLERPNFVEVSYVMHVLDPIYPDPDLTERENSIAMYEKDYAQKVAAYEEAYGRKLDYRFEIEDIAGWVPTEKERAALKAREALEALEEKEAKKVCVTV